MKKRASQILKNVELFLKLAEEELKDNVLPSSKFEEEFSQPLKTKNSQLHDILSEFLMVPISQAEFADWQTANKQHIGNYLDRFVWKIENGIIKGSNNTDKIIISKEKINTKNLVLRSAALLNSTSRIQKLFFFDIESEQSVLDEQSSHEYWLIQALSLINKVDEKQILKYIPEFITENKASINRLRKLFKSSVPTLLGSGEDGAAFSISDKLVLKIFKDQHAFNTFKEAEERLHKNQQSAKTEAMIYDVGQLGNFLGINIFYCIMEKIPAISNIADRKKLFVILDIMKNMVLANPSLPSLIKNIRSGDNVEQTQQEVFSFVKDILAAVSQEASNVIVELQQNLSLNENWLPVFVEEFVMKYLTGRRDLHTANLGINQQGYIRYFDAAHGSPDKELWVGRKDVHKPNAGTVVPGEGTVAPKGDGTKIEKPKPLAFDEATKASRSDKLLALASRYLLLAKK